jgi:hypothetical protein
MSDMPWREAVIEIMRREGAAMHYADIAERIVTEGLRSSVGATPASTVSATITTSINGEGDNSPFRRVARGEYILTEPGGAPFEVPAMGGESTVPESEESVGPIPALGMFWDRSLVAWKSTPAILGKQQIGADPVDLCDQRGIYLLHDVREVIYVGRSTDRPLGTRLYEHTFDRLKTRWTRFSWFGVRPVHDDGSLGDPVQTIDSSELISVIESLLIEALEPPQNRRRGDGFTAVEFMQAEDPAIKQAQLQEFFARVQRSI